MQLARVLIEIARCGQGDPARNDAIQAGKTVEATLPASLNWNVLERDRRLNAGKERRQIGGRLRSQR